MNKFCIEFKQYEVHLQERKNIIVNNRNGDRKVLILFYIQCKLVMVTNITTVLFCYVTLLCPCYRY